MERIPSFHFNYTLKTESCSCSSGPPLSSKLLFINESPSTKSHYFSMNIYREIEILSQPFTLTFPQKRKETMIRLGSVLSRLSASFTTQPSSRWVEKRNLFRSLRRVLSERRNKRELTRHTNTHTQWWAPISWLGPLSITLILLLTVFTALLNPAKRLICWQKFPLYCYLPSYFITLN